ncbi:MAG: hypothetical protein ACRC3Z_07860 [Phocaeicola sp.]
MKRPVAPILRYFLALLFTLYLAGITLFTHPHIVNGVVIVHSHVFNGEHEHTAVEFETIFFLSTLAADTSFFFAPLLAPLFLVFLGMLLLGYSLVAPHVQERGSIQLRAPPVLA